VRIFPPGFTPRGLCVTDCGRFCTLRQDTNAAFLPAFENEGPHSHCLRPWPVCAHILRRITSHPPSLPPASLSLPPHPRMTPSTTCTPALTPVFALGLCAEHLGAQFAPYVGSVLEIVVPLLRNRSDDVRFFFFSVLWKYLNEFLFGVHCGISYIVYNDGTVPIPQPWWS
jgi:hypothetical protein